MMRTLVDEGFEGAALAARLNAQIVKQRPASRLSRCFSGCSMRRPELFGYVNAGKTHRCCAARTGPTSG
jgi:hypothetical protein